MNQPHGGCHDSRTQRFGNKWNFVILLLLHNLTFIAMFSSFIYCLTAKWSIWKIWGSQSIVSEDSGLLTLRPFTTKHFLPLKHREPVTQWHNIISQNTWSPKRSNSSLHTDIISCITLRITLILIHYSQLGISKPFQLITKTG